MLFMEILSAVTLSGPTLAAGDIDVFENLMNGTKKFKDYPYFAEALENWKMRLVGARADDMSNTQDMGLKCLRLVVQPCAMMVLGQ